jgi:hypothetical protein
MHLGLHGTKPFGMRAVHGADVRRPGLQEPCSAGPRESAAG